MDGGTGGGVGESGVGWLLSGWGLGRRGFECIGSCVGSPWDQQREGRRAHPSWVGEVRV